MSGEQYSNLDDFCPCGSTRRYRSCCYFGRVRRVLPRARTAAEASLFERNVLLYDGLHDIFGARVKLDRLKENIGEDQVRQVYELFVSLFPTDSDIELMIPKPGAGLRGLYIGSQDPLKVLNNVVRYSLYCDEILVVNPLVHAGCMAPNYNPLLYPGQFRQTTLKSVVSLFMMEDWVRQEFVLLMPDPCDFDFGLRKAVVRLADDRAKTLQFTAEEMAEAAAEAKDDISRFILSMPEQYLREQLRQLSPDFIDEDIEKTISLRNRMVEGDPLNIGSSEAQLQITRTGANLELATLIANAANAFPFTNLKARWREILSSIHQFPKDSSVWSPLTESFQDLNFAFLDNVSPKFAKQIRDERRLESLRNLLRKIWLRAGEEKTHQDSIGRDFRDELQFEYGKAKAEFTKIDVELAKWSAATVGGVLLSGHLNMVFGGAAVAGVSLLAKRFLQRRAFRLENPLSVFLDLERGKKWTP